MSRAEEKAESSEEVSTGPRDDRSQDHEREVLGHRTRFEGRAEGSDTMRKSGPKRREVFGS